MASSIVNPGGSILYLNDARVAIATVQKVGGSSIKQTIGNAYMTPRDRNWKSCLDSLRVVTPERVKFPVIAICRNPIDRALSFYVDKLVDNKPLADLTKLGFKANMPVDEFVDVLGNTPDKIADKHFRSQYLTFFANGMIPNTIIHLEKIEEGWKWIQKLVKAKGSRILPDLPVLQKSKGEKPALTNRQSNAIRNRYAMDFQLLGYGGA